MLTRPASNARCRRAEPFYADCAKRRHTPLSVTPMPLISRAAIVICRAAIVQRARGAIFRQKISPSFHFIIVDFFH
jgi:hypothetical protein